MEYVELIYQTPIFNNIFADNVKTTEDNIFHRNSYKELAGGVDYEYYFENFWGVDAIALYVQELQMKGDTRKTIEFMVKLLRALYYANCLKDVHRDLITKISYSFGLLSMNNGLCNLDDFYTNLNNFITCVLSNYLQF